MSQPDSSYRNIKRLICSKLHAKFTELSPIESPTTNSNTEAQVINLSLPNCTIIIVNVYHPDNSNINTDLFKKLSSSSSAIKIILGNLNAKNLTWGCSQLHSKGEQFEDLPINLNLSTLNTGDNTYVSKTKETSSAIDITAIGLPHHGIAKWRVIKSVISDHFPIVTKLSLEVGSVSQLKMSRNFRKKNVTSVITTNRKNRKSFRPSIKIFNSTINRISNPKYLVLTLGTELRFTKHIEATSLRVLKELSILRKLCGSTWDSKPKTLLNTYNTIVRPVLEYAAPIWAPASSSTKEKIDTVQYRASKISIGAVCSTNNLSAEMEYNLTPFESRRKN
ncbi:reverse transcriptase domain-containing protein [Trichonephila clavipes]|nr:reverse transcriptase domain-containing protein [Trichonephila clavipes]